MFSVENPGDGKDDEKNYRDCSNLAELAEVHDVLEVDGPSEFDGLVPHGLDQVLRDISLVQFRIVLELHVGDEQRAQLRVALLDLKSGRERVITLAVLPPFAVIDPDQDSYVNQEESEAGNA